MNIVSVPFIIRLSCKIISLRSILRNGLERNGKGVERGKLITEFQVSVSNCSNFKHNGNEGKVFPIRNISYCHSGIRPNTTFTELMHMAFFFFPYPLRSERM